MVDNPEHITPCAMNHGIRNSQGKYIAILSAHALYPRDYLTLCVETMKATDADNVGGIFVTMQNGEHYGAKAVQALTTHSFGVGRSYRTAQQEGPVDTVAYGFYKRSVFMRIGWFDQRLVRAQDYEFNRRLSASGGRIWLNPRIQVYYYNQGSLIQFYKKQFYREAPYNAYMWYLAPYAFSPRHAITGLFTLGVLTGSLLSAFTSWIAYPFISVMSLYGVLAIIASSQQAARYREPRHLLFLPILFLLFHLIHGLGILIGVARLLTLNAPVQRVREPWPGANRRRIWPLGVNPE
jgi:glycosyltransferase involved in cell wall biosynthesis